MNQIEKVARAICRADPEVRMGDADGVVEQRVNIEWVHYVDQAKAAIAAMPVQAEPVAWMYQRDDGSRDLLLDCNGEYARNLIELGATETPLYALPIPTPPAGGSDAE